MTDHTTTTRSYTYQNPTLQMEIKLHGELWGGTLARLWDTSFSANLLFSRERISSSGSCPSYLEKSTLGGFA